jgi:hypothetical protein
MLLSDDKCNNFESENIFRISVHELPYVTLKSGFRMYHKRVAEFK